MSFIGMSISNGRVFQWFTLCALWIGVVAPANAVIEIVGETHATFAWDSPAGAVEGYYVYVSRNGATEALYSTLVGTNSQTIDGSYGESIRVSTAAFDAYGNTGPRSDPSEEVRFVEVSAA